MENSVIITSIICITIITISIIASKIYLRLKLNKDFAIKGKNIMSAIFTFKNSYMEDCWSNDGKNSKYKGKGIELYTLLKTIERIIDNK